MDEEQKKRIADLAARLLAFLSQDGDDGDSTEDLASLYAAAQIVERELLAGGHLDMEQLAFIQVVGKRVGALTRVVLKTEVIDDPHNVH